ncbi:MAG: HDOD domain-containing protein [Desulfarculus sp.]|nr:HDOD domain-containing protein [Desulfarculus sp.]
MTRILFVDDEPNVLDGLRRMLRDMRHKWDMSFAASGVEALQILAKERYDIIVSDMRMPVIDGAMLLAQVRKLYPHMARIILSGHSERKAIMQSVRLAHQYLAKPCDPDKLKRVLQQTAAMRALLSRDNLIGMVAQIESLPPLPHTYSRLLEALDSEDSSLETIGELISQDMGMTTTVLKLVNSAFFGLPHQVASPAQAVGLLGLDVIKGLVLSQGLFEAFDTMRVPGMSFQELWRHCLAVGGYARRIVQVEAGGKPLADGAFIAGILHDVGKLVLATVAPQEYAQVIQTVREQGRPVSVVEREVLGATHGEAGAYLMGLWGLHEGVVGAIATHNHPEYAGALGGTSGRLLLAAVHAANVFEREIHVINPQYALPKLDRGFLAEANLAGKASAWRRACQEISTPEGAHGTD